MKRLLAAAVVVGLVGCSGHSSSGGGYSSGTTTSAATAPGASSNATTGSPTSGNTSGATAPGVITPSSLVTSDYTVTVTPSTAVTPGQQTTFDIQVFDKTGLLVTDFVPVHTQIMHMVLVSQDLADFQHVHPVAQPTGDFTVDVTLGLAQTYAVFIECQPVGATDEILLEASVTAAGSQPAAPQWTASGAFDGSSDFANAVGNTTVTLTTAPNATPGIQANVTAHLMISVRDQSGGPANVEDWLGMGGHAIVLSGDLTYFEHDHALRGGTTSSSMGGMSGMPSSTATTGTSGMAAMPGMPNPIYAGPTSDDLTFDVTVPSAGIYEVFFQFQRAGQVYTVPFLVNASP